MVMPRAFSSGAASIWSYALASPPYSLLATFVIAAVNVVLPWSTCPIVPTFTWGLVRSNFAFAMRSSVQDRTASRNGVEEMRRGTTSVLDEFPRRLSSTTFLDVLRFCQARDRD